MTDEDRETMEHIKKRCDHYVYSGKYPELEPQLVFDFGFLMGLISRLEEQLQERNRSE